MVLPHMSGDLLEFLVAIFEIFFEDGASVTPQAMFEAGLLRKPTALVKILGDGELEKKLTVSAHKFSASAIEKISAKGGTAEVIGGE